MEEDVYYHQIAALEAIIDSNSTADLLLQDDISPVLNSTWWHEFYVKEQNNGFFHNDTLSHTMLNLFRMSRKLIESTENYYHAQGESWMFNEALFPSLAIHYNLTSQKWHTQNPDSMRYRPCHLEFKEDILYHTAKNRGGVWVECTVESDGADYSKMMPRTGNKTLAAS